MKSEGTGSSAHNLRDVFTTGRGTGLLYIQPVVQAIRNKRDMYVSWPNSQERKLISRHIEDKCGLPNCVGIIDGTLFPLRFRPQTTNAPDYNGRKYHYSMSGVIICDDMRYIRYYEVGWPGCAHGNQIAKSTTIWHKPNKYFKKNQYIIGDSAFDNLWFMVSAFTCPPGQTLDVDKTLFNTQLSKA